MASKKRPPRFIVFVERTTIETGQVPVPARSLKTAVAKIKKLIESEGLIVDQWEFSAAKFRPFGGQREQDEELAAAANESNEVE